MFYHMPRSGTISNNLGRLCQFKTIIYDTSKSNAWELRRVFSRVPGTCKSADLSFLLKMISPWEDRHT